MDGQKFRTLTYCSFADDDGCLGIVILEGELLPAAAAKRAHTLGVNPGGELLALPVIEGDHELPPGMFERMAGLTNRLFSKDEAVVLFEARSIRDYEANRDR